MVTRAPLFKNDSHLSDEGVALYVDALKLHRTEDLPDEVCDHVADCQSCRKEITGLFSILAEEDYGAIGQHPFFDNSGEGERKKVKWIYQIAALILAGIGISLIAYFVYPGREGVTPVLPHTSSGIVKSSDTSAEHRSMDSRVGDAAGGTYADNFAELPELEGLVALETRSSALDGVSPKTGINVSQPVVFDWKAEGKALLVLSVLTNKDSLVHRSRVAMPPYVLRSSLEPGLYYWKLENAEEVVFVGKFLVR